MAAGTSYNEPVSEWNNYQWTVRNASHHMHSAPAEGTSTESGLRKRTCTPLVQTLTPLVQTLTVLKQQYPFGFDLTTRSTETKLPLLTVARNFSS